MINRQLDIDELRGCFLRDSAVTIEHWLDTDYAASLHAYFNQLPDESWSTVARPSFDKAYRDTYRLTPENRDPVEKCKRHANLAHARGEFAFVLNRTLADHETGCSCIECTLLSKL